MSGDSIRVAGYWALGVVAVAMAGLFMVYSMRLAAELSDRERQRMVLWADAVAEVLSANDAKLVEFPTRIIEDNHGIPALLMDESGNVLMTSNLSEEDSDTTKFYKTTKKLISTGKEIRIETEPGTIYRVCYGDSALLSRLKVYPYIELSAVIIFLVITYLAIQVSRRASQNRIWVGLSRETAHQLGTPISSLMGWIACLQSGNASNMSITDAVGEMERDVSRLADVAERFSKIGTCPPLLPFDFSELIYGVAEYMKRRISSAIEIETDMPENQVVISGSAELLRWVLENLIKNSADAINRSGKIVIRLRSLEINGGAVVEVSDTGKGIPRNKWKSIFRAGYTTKGRGWGLGLTLARRIVEQYHKGSIAVVSSAANGGTTIRITIP